MSSAGLDELLVLSSTEVRRWTGLSWQTIRMLRERLGRDRPAAGRPWQAGELALVGTAPEPGSRPGSVLTDPHEQRPTRPRRRPRPPARRGW